MIDRSIDRQTDTVSFEEVGAICQNLKGDC